MTEESNVIEMLKQLPKGIVVNKISGDYTNEGSEALITEQGPSGTTHVGHIAKTKTTMPGSVNFNQVLPNADPSSQGLAVGSIVEKEINKGKSFSTNSDSERAMAAMGFAANFMARHAPNAGLQPAPNPISPVSKESLTDGPQQISGTGQQNASVPPEGGSSSTPDPQSASSNPSGFHLVNGSVNKPQDFPGEGKPLGGAAGELSKKEELVHATTK
ncbi:unnamed protein product [Allacma fusca]|uniref:Uncharacterized protein n=1 Tax=Allacma fusca TaxID=39272 RepID=A0A8J2PKC1_9HEXA|nr:unnamed protein product [Allacma fusca]